MVQPSLEFASQNQIGKKINSSTSSTNVSQKKHPLHKIFNRHTLKLIYSCMPNMKSIIASHNKTVLSNYTSTPATEHVKECNCRKKEQCPLEGQCLINNIVYQAIVTTNTTTETYIGLATNVKERYRNHTSPPRRVLPYLGYMGTCRWTGYGFWPRCPKQGIQFDLSLS